MLLRRAEDRGLFFFACHFWKPLKFILGLQEWKFSATEGPQQLAADRALFLESASDTRDPQAGTRVLTRIRYMGNGCAIQIGYVSHTKKKLRRGSLLITNISLEVHPIS